MFNRFQRFFIQNSLFLLLWGILLLLGSSCKKEIKVDPEIKNPPTETKRTDSQLLRDSIYYYYKLHSLWTNHIKEAKPISSFTDSFRSPLAVLEALKEQTPFYAPYGGAIDRFSEIEYISSNVASSRSDNSDGYGIYTTILRNGNEMTGDIFVYFVEGGSPGQIGDIRRGDRITNINGRAIPSIPLRVSASGEMEVTDPTHLNYVRRALDGNNLDIEVERTDGTTYSQTLRYKTYPINPLLKDTVYVRGTKNIGYFALSSFEEITDDDGKRTPLYHHIEQIISKFEQANISDVIIDLRYNIGGYVSTTEFLANKLINNSGNGQVMFTYEVNEYLDNQRKRGSREFAEARFKKNNSLDIKNYYFLVTKTTASASEILISVMKPYAHVEIIADIDGATYGKPVGFFRQEIMDQIGLWAASFKTVNANGYKDYWDGIPGTRKNIIDDVLRSFGDPDEAMIAEALRLADPSSSGSSSQNKSRSANHRNKTNLYQKVQDVNKVKGKKLLKK